MVGFLVVGDPYAGGDSDHHWYTTIQWLSHVCSYPPHLPQMLNVQKTNDLVLGCSYII